MKLVSNERGTLNVLLVPLILSVVFFFGAIGFGVWAFMERDDYKKNSDEKSAAAVEIAIKKNSTEKDNEFIEKEKEPLRDYQGSDSLGSIQFRYPKTWSGHYTDSNTASTLVMHPGLVSGNEKSLYALRVEVESKPYDKVVQTYESDVKSDKVSASAYRLPQLQEIVGVRLEGEIKNGVQGVMIILPLRDKTLRISSESEDFAGDFDNIILKNFTFSP